MVGPPDGISRRDLIRRSVVAGGLVWAAPAVVSIKTRDAAAGTPPPTTSPTTTATTMSSGCNQANSFQACGDVRTDCGLDGQCFCIQTAEGDFVCAGDLDDACSSPGPPRCTSSSQCPPSEPICLTPANCCGDGFGRCIKPCSAETRHKKHKQTSLTPLG